MLQHFFVLSSWAITRWKEEEEEKEGESPFQSREREEFYARLDSRWKTAIGFKVKRCIDMGRCLYLAAQGYSSLIEQYCSSALSPENLVILIK